MKKLIFILMCAITINGMAQSSYKPMEVNSDTLPNYSMRTIENKAFTVGEKLTYTVHYGWINAGEAVLTVEDSPYKFGNREAYHVVGTGKSLGGFDMFFKVRDRFETYIDKQGIFPHRFIRNCDEGGYIIEQDYTFKQYKRTVEWGEKEYKTPRHVQDMISAFYYARTLDFSNVKEGDVYTVQTIVDEEIYDLKLKFVGRENIEIRKGEFACMKFVPIVQEGRIFKSEDDLSVWITDDDNKIPVLVKSKILVGSIKMEMTDWSGLANPLAIVD